MLTPVSRGRCPPYVWGSASRGEAAQARIDSRNDSSTKGKALDYYYSQTGGQQQGPVSADELKRLNLPASTLVWRDGMSNWLPMAQVPELGGDMSSGAPQHYAMPMNYAQAQAVPPANGLAITALVCGIVGVPMSCLFVPSVLAIIFGHIARGQIRRGQGGGDGMALAGLIMGYIMTAIGGLYWLFNILFFTLAISGAAAGGVNKNRPFGTPRPTPVPTVPSSPSTSASPDNLLHSIRAGV